MLGQRLRAGQVYEIHQVLREVGRVGLLTTIVEHAQWRRSVAVQARVGIGVAQIDIGAVGLPADLTEALPDARRRNIAPSVLIEVVAGEEVIEGAEFAAGLTL